MSNFQTNTLFGAVLIAVFWLLFCIKIIDIDVYVGVLGAVSSICIGLRIGRSQKRMGFVGGVLSIITTISFIFSIIPVYTYNASLSTFYAGQVPSIVCDSSTQGTIDIDSTSVSMKDICKRGQFPLISEQKIDVKTSQPVLINLAMGRSIIVPSGYNGIIKRSIEDGLQTYNFNTPVPPSVLQTTNQETIRQYFLQSKREYLQKNYPRKREYAPSITKIAIRKMRLLSLIDRSYNDKVKNLEFYMNEIK